MKKKKTKLNNFRNFYICLAIMRIILVLFPQTGYIHPDEYFQAIEVLTGET